MNVPLTYLALRDVWYAEDSNEDYLEVKDPLMKKIITKDLFVYDKDVDIIAQISDKEAKAFIVKYLWALVNLTT